MRGTGLGSALFTEVIKYAHNLGVRRIDWNVLDWNEPAIAFYEKNGARVLRDWDVAQMDEEGIKILFQDCSMRIFKFGGASVKDADGVKNVVSVLRTVGFENTLLVVSAMGKTTNAMEIVVKNYFENEEELLSSIQEVKKYHNGIYLNCLRMKIILFIGKWMDYLLN